MPAQVYEFGFKVHEPDQRLVVKEAGFRDCADLIDKLVKAMRAHSARKSTATA